MLVLELGGNTYSTGSKLDAFTQLHMARKLSPAMPIIDAMFKESNGDKDKSVLSVLLLSRITDEDTDYLVRKCLSTAFRRQPDGKLAKIQAPDGSLMFDDMTLDVILELTMKILEDNLGDFFRTALAGLERDREQSI
jgi:hypothetical protein